MSPAFCWSGWWRTLTNQWIFQTTTRRKSKQLILHNNCSFLSRVLRDINKAPEFNHNIMGRWCLKHISFHFDQGHTTLIPPQWLNFGKTSGATKWRYSLKRQNPLRHVLFPALRELGLESSTCTGRWGGKSRRGRRWGIWKLLWDIPKFGILLSFIRCSHIAGTGMTQI